MSPRLAFLLVISVAVACDEDEAIAPSASCPNEVPVAGTPCPEVGLTCNYFTGCDTYFPATCQADGWSFVDDCPALVGGGMPGGGMPDTTSSTTTASSTASTTTTSGAGGGLGGAGGTGFGGAGGI